MPKESEEKGMIVSGAKIREVLSDPEAAFNTLIEFCTDISTLSDSMHNLYEQHPIEFGLLGVQVEVIVRSKSMDKELLHHEFGSTGDVQEILRHPVTHGETISKEEEING